MTEENHDPKFTIENDVVVARIAKGLPGDDHAFYWTVWPIRDGQEHDEPIFRQGAASRSAAADAAGGFVQGYKLAMDTVSRVVAALNDELDED